jgi:hypothetical protein
MSGVWYLVKLSINNNKISAMFDVLRVVLTNIHVWDVAAH